MSTVQGQSEESVDFIGTVDFAVFADFAGSGDSDRYAYYWG